MAEQDSTGPGAAAVPTVEQLTRVVALDGPAGTGKSSVARGVAVRLGWRFVDTGATYRAVTLAVLEAGVDPQDAAAVLAVARAAVIELGTLPEHPTVVLDGRDVAEQIRSAEVTARVSDVSAVQAVRELLIGLQRLAAGTDGAVVEGRDIATVVAPLAAVKVYLDARPEIRAARRAGETLTPHTTAQVGTALQARDARDDQTNRLAPSGGAVHLDTSELVLEQVIDAVVGLARAAGVAP